MTILPVNMGNDQCKIKEHDDRSPVYIKWCLYLTDVCIPDSSDWKVDR